MCTSYTPGIYADGYIVFAFPFVHSSVRMFVRSFVRTSVTFVEFASKFCVKVSEVVHITATYHSSQSESIHIWTIVTLEGWHSLHDHGPGSMPRGGARGQNLGHL